MRLSLGIVAFTCLLGCGATNKNAQSQLKHDDDAPIRNLGGGVWAQLTDEDYENAMAPLVGVDSRNLVPDSDALTVRAQHWLDIFDANYRSRHANEMAGIPHPRARVVKTSNVNAFVSSVFSCFVGPVSIQGRETVENAEAAFLDFGSGGAIALTADQVEQELGDLPCRAWNGKFTEAATMASAFNRQNPTCEMRVTGRGETITRIDFIGQCGSQAQANRLIVNQVSDIVHFFTGIFSEFTEEQFSSVVAHELGHYYRSHGMEPNSAFNYFYRLSEQNPDHRPERDPAFDSMIPRAKIFSQIVDNFSRINRIPNQRLHSATYLTTGSFVKNLCSAGNTCPTECTDALQSLRTTTYMRDVGTFPFTAVTAASAITHYTEHETRMNRCLAAIPVTAQSGQRIFQALVQSIARPTWPAVIVSTANPTLARKVSSFNSFMLAYLRDIVTNNPTAFDTAANAGAIMEEFNTGLVADEASALAMYERIFTEHLGQYTTEQEADEISVEQVSKSGIDPSNAVNTYLEFAKMGTVGAVNPFRTLGFTDCKALMDHGWHDSNSQYSFIAVGNLVDPHHGACYRAFNSDREISAHRYTATGTAPAMLADGTWPDLQRHATELSDDAFGPSNTPPSFVTAAASNPAAFLKTKHLGIREKALSQCTFAPESFR